MLKHGENIVDLMGGEIDRIEMKLRVSRAFFGARRVINDFFTEKVPVNPSLRLGNFVKTAAIT